jgi:hypothetical protein
MTKSFYDVLSTIKTTTLLMISTSSQQPTPHQLVREWSTTSQRSHDVWG